MAIEPHMNDPDWDRYLVATQQAHAGPPVGNPIRWGGIATMALNPDVPEDANGLIGLETGPVVNAAAADGYARAWSIVGTLSMPLSALYTDFSRADPRAVTPRPGNYPRPADGTINVMLDVVLGAGQMSLRQRILLMAGGAAALGLCNQQSAINNGPYAEIHSTDPILAAVSVSRSFAAIGALVANTISIRGFFELGGDTAKSPVAAILSIAVSPYAAGTQL